MLIKIAKSYENFIDYLKDDNVEIDYEYLWDLICFPNPKLFKDGVNMVIIELSRKDITDNVQLICPSNHYSSSLFNSKRKTIIILKIYNYYEPICQYNKNEELITYGFNPLSPAALPNIKKIISMVKNTFDNKCKPLKSMPNIYSFSESIQLNQLAYYILSLNMNYTIESQVMNYDNKIIGLVIKNNRNNNKGFVPCYPSSQLNNKDTILIDDIYTTSYEKTKDFLEEHNSIATKNEIKIPCKPYMKVLEDGLVVGILTISNQFVMIDEPTQPIEDDLIAINSLNYNDTDKKIMTSNKVDKDRETYINNIRLETQFYNVFRNTARYLLGQYGNTDIRKEIEEKVNSSYSYLKKINSIEQLLIELLKNNITFHSYSAEELLQLKNITSCYVNCKNNDYCKKDASGNCLLMVPAINLINSKENIKFYYGKLADEIIRYIRVNSFIFNPQTLVSFSKLNYNLKEYYILF